MTAIHQPLSAQSGNQPDIEHSAMVGDMPDTRGVNFYEAAPYLRLLLHKHLDPHELEAAEPLLRDLGGRVGNQLEDLAAEADRQSPPLVARDKRGDQVNVVLPDNLSGDPEIRVSVGDQTSRAGIKLATEAPAVATLFDPVTLNR